MGRPYQIGLDQSIQPTTKLDQDIQTRVDEIRPKCTDQNKPRLRCTDQIRADQPKVCRPKPD